MKSRAESGTDDSAAVRDGQVGWRAANAGGGFSPSEASRLSQVKVCPSWL